ncbi:MAG: hypothetical protein ACE5DX_05420 [Candidatus Dojkabacteria bacterium]
MNLKDLRETVAENLNYLTQEGDVVDADVDADTIDRFINNRYLEEVYPVFGKRHPEFYSQSAVCPTYDETGTADTSSTGTTLVATTPIFTNAMVGAKVLNSTDDVVAKIESYTNTTTVELDTTIDDDWDSDTIYVFTGVYTLLGDLTDASSILWVGIKYQNDSSSGEPTTDHIRVMPAKDEDIYRWRRGTRVEDTFAESDPRYIFEARLAAGLPTSTLKILPIPETLLLDNNSSARDDGVFVRYKQKPSKLVNDTDVPRLPEGHHLLLAHGATADCFIKMGQTDRVGLFDNSINEPWEGTGKYNRSFKALMAWRGAERVNRAVNFTESTEFILARDRGTNAIGRGYGTISDYLDTL